jgi:hypothetical protein
MDATSLHNQRSSGVIKITGVQKRQVLLTLKQIKKQIKFLSKKLWENKQLA